MSTFRLDWRIRIGVITVIAIILIISIIADRKNRPAQERMLSFAEQQIRASPKIQSVVGNIRSVSSIEKQSDTYDGQPAYRLVEHISASKGDFESNIDIVQEGAALEVFNLDLIPGDGNRIRIIEYGKAVH